MNSELAERLDLDPRQLDRAARATELYARGVANIPADERPDVQQNGLLQSATLLTVAACYWLLLDPPRSFPLFIEASNLYVSLGRSFAYVVAICGAVRQFPQMPSSHNESGTEIDVEETHHLLLREAWDSALGVSRFDPERVENLLTELSNQRAWPTGRLQVPQRSHLAVLRDSINLTSGWSHIADSGSIDIDPLARDLQSFLVRADEQVEIAMSDRYHWRRLQSALLPVEPEAVAMCAVGVASALAAFGEGILDRIDVSERAAVPLRLGTEIARIARQEGISNITLLGTSNSGSPYVINATMRAGPLGEKLQLGSDGSDTRSTNYSAVPTLRHHSHRHVRSTSHPCRTES